MGGKRPQGYTIVEAMIFLAVTSVMFVLIAGSFSGQTSKAEFTSSVRQLDSQLQDTMNDIASGYYPVFNDIRCRAVGGGPSGQQVQFDNAPTGGQGTNQACTYIGRVIKFTPVTVGSSSAYRIMSVAGLRTNGGAPVQNMTQASPRVVALGNQYDNYSDTIQYPPGLELKWICYTNGCNDPEIGAFGVFSTFANVSSTGGLQSGSTGVDLYPITGSSITEDLDATAGNIHNLNTTSVKNPAGGITMCFEGGRNQHALIKIGGRGSNTSTFTEIIGGNCP